MGSQVWGAALGGETAKKHAVRRGVSVACLAFEAPSRRLQRAHAATFSTSLLLHGAEVPPSDISKRKPTQLTPRNRGSSAAQGGHVPALPRRRRTWCWAHLDSLAFTAEEAVLPPQCPQAVRSVSCRYYCHLRPCCRAGVVRLRRRPKPDRQRHALAHCSHRQAAPLGLAHERRTPAEGGGRGSWGHWQYATAMHARVRVPGLLQHYQQHVSPEASGAHRGRPARWPSSSNAFPATRPPPHPHSWLPCCTERPNTTGAVRRVHRTSSHKVTSGVPHMV